ncbi:MAG: hypothetical protein HYT85_06615 [candidate division NC10 bacterium]|nr:hypothetical protein [candidate division NC10 bacterium]
MYYERSRALKRRMRAGETTFGAFLSFQDPGAAEIMAGTGYDWVFIDNDGIVVVLQIEHEDGVRQVKEILDAPGIDVVCLGPMDLSGSLGILGQLEHPRVVEAIERVMAAAKDRGLPVCVPMETSLEAQIAWARKGARFVVTGEDHGLLRRAAADALNRYRAALA